jgi:tetrapyrrole methylase family protein / MazG family protein
MPTALTAVAGLLDALPPADRPTGALQILASEGAFEPNPLAPLVAVLPGDGDGRRAVAEMLRRVYPPEHPATVLAEGRAPGPTTLAAALDGGAAGALYLPPLGRDDAERSLQGLRALVHRLRAPGGCPWDREQTHESLAKYVIEEAYEVVDAIRHGTPADLAEELGDLLLQVYLQAELAEEAGRFTLNDVAEHLSRKLVRRHPHVFGDVAVGGAADVEVNWDRLKQAEKADRAEAAARSALDGIPRSLPALMLAQEVQKKLKKAGFDWPDPRGVEEKLAEEVAELRASATPEEAAAELGDVLFILVRLGLDRGANAEDALRGTIRRVEERYRYVEARLGERGRTPKDAGIDELRALWDEAKAKAARS